MKGLDLLQEKLEKHKECLKDVDVMIQRINGREQLANLKSDSNVVDGTNTQVTENNENNLLIKRSFSNSDNNNHRRDVFSDRNRTMKRRYNDDSRHNSSRKRRQSDHDSDVEEPLPKHSLQSSVISKQVVIKSKDDLIKLQNKDTGSQQRNKRIFGMILGTLQKFKTDDKMKSETSQARQRKEIEKKIEVKEIEEKNKIKEERTELYKQRRSEQIKIKIIEQKLQMVTDLENWCKQQENYKKFIKTQTKPYVFYLPKILEPKTEKLLADCASVIEEEIKKRKADTEKEIENLADDERQLSLKDTDRSRNGDDIDNKKDSSETDSDSEMDDDRNDVKIGVDDDDDDDDNDEKEANSGEINVEKETKESDNDDSEDKKNYDIKVENESD